MILITSYVQFGIRFEKFGEIIDIKFIRKNTFKKLYLITTNDNEDNNVKYVTESDAISVKTFNENKWFEQNQFT